MKKSIVIRWDCMHGTWDVYTQYNIVKEISRGGFSGFMFTDGVDSYFTGELPVGRLLNFCGANDINITIEIPR